MKSKGNIFAVLTTINKPNYKVSDWKSITDNKTIVVGDKKTSANWSHPDCIFISLKKQLESKFQMSRQLPINHYTRKNIGYLWAIQKGADGIIDTDDDNYPNTNSWNQLLTGDYICNSFIDSEKLTFKNVYTYFSDCSDQFWPRGFPLNLINSKESLIEQNDLLKHKMKIKMSVWQCIVDGDPDIDAIHRLIFSTTPKFKQTTPLVFGRNIICPINSQNTFWLDHELFPLLYLPSTVSFRFTDILRGYIAQTIINVTSKNWGFYPSTSYQIRNDHNLLEDFKSEITMYENSYEIVQMLSETTKPNESVESNLHNSYSNLINYKYVKPQELRILDSWLSDLDTLKH